ncbi:MAG: DUF692 domain-containing protein [Streptococcaceae bacterium]|nr:DUF692 domain-containing protein [Streptococcaceae bacterium]
MKFGICYRPYLHKKFLEKIVEEISFIEIMPEVTNVSEMSEIKYFCQQNNIDMGLHCLKSSLFSPEGPQKEMLEKYFYLSEYLNSKYFSDHIAISHVNDVYLTSVHPIKYTEKNIKVFQNNLSEIQKYFPKNFYVENITQNKLLEGSEIAESQFINKLNQDLLFDLTNIYITAKRNNIAFDKYIENYPFDKVKVMHISGLSVDDDGIYHDIHSENFDEEIRQVLQSVKNKLINLEIVLIERDFNISSADDILKDLKMLKEELEIK